MLYLSALWFWQQRLDLIDLTDLTDLTDQMVGQPVAIKLGHWVP